MSGKTLLIFVLFSAVNLVCRSQDMSTTSSLFHRDEESYRMGKLSIEQDPAIDSLINRYILYNRKINGMEGFRIQIYNSSERNAKEESGKMQIEFMSKFPNITSYVLFEKPGYYKIRAGDYRTRIEGTKYLLMIRKVFPDAYLVHDIINFQD
jgi:hypothetical protein